MSPVEALFWQAVLENSNLPLDLGCWYRTLAYESACLYMARLKEDAPVSTSTTPYAIPVTLDAVPVKIFKAHCQTHYLRMARLQEAVPEPIPKKPCALQNAMLAIHKNNSRAY